MKNMWKKERKKDCEGNFIQISHNNNNNNNNKKENNIKDEKHVKNWERKK